MHKVTALHNHITLPAMKALWNNQVLAESNETIVVENNHYFPKNSINAEFFKDSATHSTCPWKGQASYYTIEVDGEQNKDAAWYYAQPKDAAAQIKDYVAFWKGVKVTN
jgi:uncharacterized protein (DUF427 family)